MSMQSFLRLGLATAALGAIANISAWAVVPTDWTGATIGVRYLAPDAATVFEDDGVVSVTAGPEGDISGFLSYDISGSQIVLRSLSSEISIPDDEFQGFRFYDASGDDLDLIGVTVNPATDIAGFTGARVTSGPDDIYVNLQGLFFPNSEYQVVLDLQFRGGQQAVPEASTWMAGGGLIGLLGGMWLRRRP